MTEAEIIARPVDGLVYEELSRWLPERILDCHVHVSLAENCGPVSDDRKSELWAVEAGVFQSWKRLRDSYAALFPGREVDVLAFGGVYREQKIECDNAYLLDGLADPANRARGLFVTRPEWSADRIAEAMSQGFLGIKPYPDLAPQGAADASIYDFVPREHLAMVDRLGGVMMLHLPRRDRLSDPDNIRELKEIRQAYPSIRLIVAHIGRSYCLPTVREGLPHFADDPGIYFDTAANLNADVFQFALETIGPKRVLYGSDLPVMMMRGMREHVGTSYINYTDGPYSWNTNRKSQEEEAEYTFYLYEELRALITAVERAGMGKAEFASVMYSNAAELLAI